MTDLFNPSSLSLCPSFLRVHPAFICLVFKRKRKVDETDDAVVNSRKEKTNGRDGG